MGVLVALAVGYVVGARVGSKDLDQVTRSLKALTASEEFADVVSAVRSHVGHTLRGVADVIEGTTKDVDAGTGDLVDRVRQLFGRG
jgi:hypothetical protein